MGLGKIRVQRLDPRTGSWSSGYTDGFAFAGLVDSNSGNAYFGDLFTGVMYYYKVITDEYHNFEGGTHDTACLSC